MGHVVTTSLSAAITESSTSVAGMPRMLFMFLLAPFLHIVCRVLILKLGAQQQ